MTLTPAQQKAIIANDGKFASLDLSGFPSLNELPETFRDDGRFARDWRDTSSATALREFVSSPDNETLRRIGEETGNTGIIDEVRQRKGESVCARFKAANPGYLPTSNNYATVVETLAFNALSPADQEGSVDEQVAALIDLGFWTEQNLTATFHALTAEGLLDVPLGSTRELSTAERLRVTRMAQAGRVDAAIGEYLKCALDGEEPDLDMLNDPDYLEACNAAVYSVFSDITLDYNPSPEHQSYLMRYAGSRPLTLPLLQQAWVSCQATEQRYQRGELLDQYQRQDTQPPSLKEIDALDDASVEKLYHGALKEYVNSFRRPNGVLA
jgi:hypothetical protein